MRQEHEDIFHDILTESCVGLFSAYGVEVEAVARRTYDGIEALSMVGVIGFTHPRVRGSLVLAATDEPIAASNPHSPSVRDWVAELSNQLLGRIKNRLLPYQVDLQMSTPLALRGSQIRLVSSERDNFPVVFKASHGLIAVWLDIEAQPSFEMNLMVSPDLAPTEGDMLLF